MKPSEQFQARIDKIFSPPLTCSMDLSGFKGALDLIEFVPSVNNLSSHFQLVWRTPVNDMSPEEMSPVLGEVVFAIYTGMRNALRKHVEAFVEDAGVYEDMVDWAMKVLPRLLADGTNYAGFARGGQIKVMFVHRYELATRHLSVEIQVHETLPTQDGRQTTVSSFTVPRNPTVSTATPKPASKTSAYLIELDDDYLAPFLHCLSHSDAVFVNDAIDDVKERTATNAASEGWCVETIDLKVKEGLHQEMSSEARLVLLTLLEEAGYKARIEPDPNKEHVYNDNSEYECRRTVLTVMWKQPPTPESTQ